MPWLADPATRSGFHSAATLATVSGGALSQIEVLESYTATVPDPFRLASLQRSVRPRHIDLVPSPHLVTGLRSGQDLLDAFLSESPLSRGLFAGPEGESTANRGGCCFHSQESFCHTLVTNLIRKRSPR